VFSPQIDQQRTARHVANGCAAVYVVKVTDCFASSSLAISGATANGETGALEREDQPYVHSCLRTSSALRTIVDKRHHAGCHMVEMMAM
jgi:hypothetical protein